MTEQMPGLAPDAQIYERGYRSYEGCLLYTSDAADE